MNTFFHLILHTHLHKILKTPGESILNMFLQFSFHFTLLNSVFKLKLMDKEKFSFMSFEKRKQVKVNTSTLFLTNVFLPYVRNIFESLIFQCITFSFCLKAIEYVITSIIFLNLKTTLHKKVNSITSPESF